MEVTKIVINGIEITTLDKPIGLEVIKLALDRDFQYSCIDTKIEATFSQGRSLTTEEIQYCLQMFLHINIHQLAEIKKTFVRLPSLPQSPCP